MISEAEQPLRNRGYIILGILAEGRFGITYRALNVYLSEIVVIKTFKDINDTSAEYSQEYSDLLKLLIEYVKQHKRISSKKHSHLVSVRDFFEEKNKPWLVMDYVLGENLFSLVQKNEALAEKEAVKYIEQVGKALQLIHEEGLIHDNVRPENIIIKHDGSGAVLMDFGVAATISPTILPKEGYNDSNFLTSEEVKRIRNSHKFTADIYNLAACLYYAVTGEIPKCPLKRELQYISLIAPQKIVPTISDKLNKVIIRGLELESKKHPKNMRQFLHQLYGAEKKAKAEKTIVRGQGLPIKKQIFGREKNNLKQPKEPNLELLTYFYNLPIPRLIPNIFLIPNLIIVGSKKLKKITIPPSYLILSFSSYTFLGFTLTPLLGSFNSTWIIFWLLSFGSILEYKTDNLASICGYAAAWNILWAWIWVYRFNKPIAEVLIWSWGATFIAACISIFAFTKLTKTYRRFDALIILLRLFCFGLVFGWIMYYIWQRIG